MSAALIAEADSAADFPTVGTPEWVVANARKRKVKRPVVEPGMLPVQEAFHLRGRGGGAAGEVAKFKAELHPRDRAGKWRDSPMARAAGVTKAGGGREGVNARLGQAEWQHGMEPGSEQTHYYAAREAHASGHLAEHLSHLAPHELATLEAGARSRIGSDPPTAGLIHAAIKSNVPAPVVAPSPAARVGPLGRVKRAIHDLEATGAYVPREHVATAPSPPPGPALAKVMASRRSTDRQVGDVMSRKAAPTLADAEMRVHHEDGHVEKLPAPDMEAAKGHAANLMREPGVLRVELHDPARAKSVWSTDDAWFDQHRANATNRRETEAFKSPYAEHEPIPRATEFSHGAGEVPAAERRRASGLTTATGSGATHAPAGWKESHGNHHLRLKGGEYVGMVMPQRTGGTGFDAIHATYGKVGSAGTVDAAKALLVRGHANKGRPPRVESVKAAHVSWMGNYDEDRHGGSWGTHRAA